MKSTAIKQSQIQEKWYVIDAYGQRIGRIATIAAELLLGKTNPMARDYLEPKAKVVIINADKIDYTAKRGFTKFYKSYSGFPGGLKVMNLSDTMEKKPTFALEHAIKGMLPKSKKGKEIATSLHVYASAEHPHVAQKPEVVDIKSYKI